MTPPSYAARIWVVDNKLIVSLPYREVSHTLTFPDTVGGMRMVIGILKSRHAESTIGTKGDPTSYQLEKGLITYDEAKVKRVGKPKPKFTSEVRASAREILRRLGI
jgi:hypothetical protein